MDNDVVTTGRRLWSRRAGVILLAGALVAAPLLPAAAVPAGTAALAGTPQFSVGTVWSNGENGMAGHRIPGMIVTTAGTVLVAAEARLGIGDTDGHDLTLKRSTDGAVTWSAGIDIEVSVNDQAWANPTLLQDRETDRVFVFYSINNGGTSTSTYYKYSDDDGATWSSRIDISSLYLGGPQTWTVTVPGPGHAIQLASGRLLVQAAHRNNEPVIADRDYGVSFIYSDDNGTTWEDGGAVTVDPMYPINESRIVEREDGAVLLIGRYGTGGVHSRVSAVSVDGGETWTMPFLASGIPTSVAVDAGLVRFSGGADPSRILFSWPNASTRADLTLGLSYDEGVTFPERRLIQSGSSGYSDIAVLDDGTILVVYELLPEIKIARLNLEWLTDGDDSVAGGPTRERILLEAEDLSWTSTDPGTTGEPSHVVLSNRRFVEFNADAVGDYVDFTFTVPTAGTYDIGYRIMKRTDRAQFQVSIDGGNVGTVQNGYTSALSYPQIGLGSLALTAGTHHIRFTVTGKSASSTDHRIGIDYVVLAK